MSMIGFVYAFAATLSFAIAAFPSTKAASHISVNSMNHLRLLLSVLLLALMAFIIEGGQFTRLFSETHLQTWCWLGLSGFISVMIGDYFSFRSFTILSPQTGTILTTLSPATALLFGIILVNEHINWVGTIGMIITIVGVMSISLGRSQRAAIPDRGHGSVTAGIMYGIIAALCFGAGIALAKKAFLVQAAQGETLGAVSATFIRVSGAAVSLFILSLITGKLPDIYRQLQSSKEGVKDAALAGIFNPTIALTMTMFTINYIPVTVAQTIFSTVPLFALFIAFIFYKVKFSLRAVVGVLAALLGVVILVYADKIIAQI